MDVVSDQTNKAQQALDRLTEKLVEDVLNASDAEILAEAREEGRDVAAEAARSRAIFAKALAAQGKRKMAAARAALDTRTTPSARPSGRLTPEQARATLARALREAPETAAKLTMAARKGQGLSDADVYCRALEVATPYRRVSRNCHDRGKLIPRHQERSGGGVAGMLLCHVGSPVDRPIREGPRCRVCPPNPF